MDGKSPANDSQAAAPSLNLQGKQVPKRTNSWKEFAGRTSGPAGYQIGDWKQGKKREQQQAQLRKQALEHSIQQEDQPGTYIVKTKAILGKGPEVTSEDLQWIAAGVALHILEVTQDTEGKRVRGRVEEPAGWISLRDTESGARWAVRQGGLSSISSPASPDPGLTPQPDTSSPEGQKGIEAESEAAASPSAVRELTFEQQSPAPVKELAEPPAVVSTAPPPAAVTKVEESLAAPEPAAPPLTKAPRQPLYMLLKQPLFPEGNAELSKPRAEEHPELRTFGVILAMAALGLRIGLLARRGRSAAVSKFILIAAATVSISRSDVFAALLQMRHDSDKKLALKN